MPTTSPVDSRRIYPGVADVMVNVTTRSGITRISVGDLYAFQRIPMPAHSAAQFQALRDISSRISVIRQQYCDPCKVGLTTALIVSLASCPLIWFYGINTFRIISLTAGSITLSLVAFLVSIGIQESRIHVRENAIEEELLAQHFFFPISSSESEEITRPKFKKSRSANF